jgi:NTP pyrophosphatase (non-canonical NTP hydrolase)
MNTYEELEQAVIAWAKARQIIPRSTPVAQARKTLEEAGELLEAAARMQVMRDTGIELETTRYQKELTAFKDAVGDTFVTLINACALADVSTVQCLGLAYDEIKDRKGTLMPNGIFVKAES